MRYKEPARMSINGVPQLKEIIIQYGRRAATSSGIRDYFKTGLVPYALKHPHITIITKPLAGNVQPHLWGHYVNGKKQKMPLKQMNPEEIEEMMERLRNQSGFHNGSTLKQWSNPRSKHKSIQDPWDADFNFNDRITAPQLDIVVTAPDLAPDARKGSGVVLMPGVRKSKRRSVSPLSEVDPDLLIPTKEELLAEKYAEQIRQAKEKK